jgi:hypothetical protein
MVCFYEWNPHFVFYLALHVARTLSLIHPPFEKKNCGIHKPGRAGPRCRGPGPGRARPEGPNHFFGLMSRPELTLTKVVRDHFHIEKPLLHFQVRSPNLIVKKLSKMSHNSDDDLDVKEFGGEDYVQNLRLRRNRSLRDNEEGSGSDVECTGSSINPSREINNNEAVSCDITSEPMPVPSKKIKFDGINY